MSNQLPNSWNELRLGDITQLITKGTTPKEYISNGINFVKVESVSENTTLLSSKFAYISNAVHAAFKRSQLKDGDILFSIAGSLGRIALIENKHLPANTNQALAIIRLSKGIINVKFCIQQLKSDTVQLELKKLQTVGAQPNLSLQQVSDISVPLPPLPEQQKIAAILTSVDDVIEKTQAQINKLKNLKTGMMQDLLTRGVGIDGKPHTEFKDSPVGRIPKGWDVWTLDDMSEKRKPVLKTGPFGSSLKSSDFKEKGVPVINIQNLGVGKLETKNIYFVTNEKARELSGYSVSEGDLVFSRVADVGRSVVIPKEAIGWIMSSNLMRISTDKSKVDSKYLMYQLVNGPSATLQLSQMVSDGGRQVVTGPTIKQLQFPIPSITEQKMIVNKIDSIDYYLNEKVKKVAQLNAIKKALMQDLLTGKVRVNVD